MDIRFFPPPSAIVGTFWEMLSSGVLANHVGISLYRIFMGFLLGVIPGIVIGLLMGLYSPIRHFVSPIVMALMPIPLGTSANHHYFIWYWRFIESNYDCGECVFPSSH